MFRGFGGFFIPRTLGKSRFILVDRSASLFYIASDNDFGCFLFSRLDSGLWIVEMNLFVCVSSGGSCL